MSTDPAEQFHNLYAYSGNGFNPINSIDPDGRVSIKGSAGVRAGLGAMGGVSVGLSLNLNAIARNAARATRFLPAVSNRLDQVANSLDAIDKAAFGRGENSDGPMVKLSLDKHGTAGVIGGISGSCSATIKSDF